MSLRNKWILTASGITITAMAVGIALAQISDGSCHAWYGAHISEVFGPDAGYETADQAIDGTAEGLGANGYERQITRMEGSADSRVELVRDGVGVVSFSIMQNQVGRYVSANYTVCLRRDGSPHDPDLDYSRFPSLSANAAASPVPRTVLGG
jgi:hypothetical protein